MIVLNSDAFSHLVIFIGEVYVSLSEEAVLLTGFRRTYAAAGR